MLDVLGLPHVKVGVIAGGSITTARAIEQEVLDVVAQHAKGSKLHRDDIVGLMYQHSAVDQLPGVREVDEVLIAAQGKTPWNITWKSGGKVELGNFLKRLADSNRAAVPEEGGPSYVLRHDHQKGDRRLFWIEEERITEAVISICPDDLLDGPPDPYDYFDSDGSPA